MSEIFFVRKRSRRSPASPGETQAASNPAVESAPEAIESPVDPKSTLGYRLTLGAVIFLGILLLAGVGVLIAGLALGWGKKGAPPVHKSAQAAKPLIMSLAPGYRILSNDTQPGRLILHVRSGETDEIDIIDLEDGRVVAQIQAEAPK